MDIKQEKIILENALKILRKGKYDFSGDEALVFHQCFSYLLDRLSFLSAPPQRTTSPIPQSVPEVTTNVKQPKTKKGI